MFPVATRNRVSPVGWDVFNVGREFDRLFGPVFNDPSLSGWTPAVDVRETDSGFLVSADLPGLTKDDIEVTVKDGVLALSGERKQEIEEGDAGAGHRILERRYGRFQRSFSLPRGVDAEKVEAQFSDGVLKVTLPKTAAAKPRRIEIGS
jgi:HSP20 family protein